MVLYLHCIGACGQVGRQALAVAAAVAVPCRAAGGVDEGDAERGVGVGVDGYGLAAVHGVGEEGGRGAVRGGRCVADGEYVGVYDGEGVFAGAQVVDGEVAVVAVAYVVGADDLPGGARCRAPQQGHGVEL